MKATLKVFIMALVGFLATTIAQINPVDWWYVLIATVAFVLMYIPKNILMPSDSDPNTLSAKDILSGVLMAISMAISSVIGSVIVNGGIDWHLLWVSVIGAVVGYITKTFFQPGLKITKK